MRLPQVSDVFFTKGIPANLIQKFNSSRIQGWLDLILRIFFGFLSKVLTYGNSPNISRFITDISLLNDSLSHKKTYYCGIFLLLINKNNCLYLCQIKDLTSF